jgi:hypothetical protein
LFLQYETKLIIQKTIAKWPEKVVELCDRETAALTAAGEAPMAIMRYPNCVNKVECLG